MEDSGTPIEWINPWYQWVQAVCAVARDHDAISTLLIDKPTATRVERMLFLYEPLPAISETSFYSRAPLYHKNCKDLTKQPFKSGVGPFYSDYLFADGAPERGVVSSIETRSGKRAVWWLVSEAEMDYAATVDRVTLRSQGRLEPRELSVVNYPETMFVSSFGGIRHTKLAGPWGVAAAQSGSTLYLATNAHRYVFHDLVALAITLDKEGRHLAISQSGEFYLLF